MFKICKRTPDADIFYSKQVAFENQNNIVMLHWTIRILVHGDQTQTDGVHYTVKYHVLADPSGRAF